MIERARQRDAPPDVLDEFPVVSLPGARQRGRSTPAGEVASATQGPITVFDLDNHDERTLLPSCASTSDTPDLDSDGFTPCTGDCDGTEPARSPKLHTPAEHQCQDHLFSGVTHVGMRLAIGPLIEIARTKVLS